MLSMNADYCCEQTAFPGFEDRTQDYWPLECSMVHDYLFDYDFMTRTPQKDHLRQMPYMCAAWQMVRSQGFEILTPTALRPPENKIFNYYHRLVSATLPLMPYKHMYWSQFITLSTQLGQCDAYNIKNREENQAYWAPTCGWEVWKARAKQGLPGCDCLALLKVQDMSRSQPVPNPKK